MRRGLSADKPWSIYDPQGDKIQQYDEHGECIMSEEADLQMTEMLQGTHSSYIAFSYLCEKCMFTKI